MSGHRLEKPPEQGRLRLRSVGRLRFD